MSKRLHYIRDFDEWYEKARKTNRPRYGFYISSGPNFMLMPCSCCKRYWGRNPVLQPNGSGICAQCNPIYWTSIFSTNKPGIRELDLDNVDESKLRGWELDYYKRLKEVHK